MYIPQLGKYAESILESGTSSGRKLAKLQAIGRQAVAALCALGGFKETIKIGSEVQVRPPKWHITYSTAQCYKGYFLLLNIFINYYKKIEKILEKIFNRKMLSCLVKKIISTIYSLFVSYR